MRSPSRAALWQQGEGTRQGAAGQEAAGNRGLLTLWPCYSMLMAYTLHAFLDEYTPTVFDNFSVIEEVDDRLVNIILWDTAGTPLAPRHTTERVCPPANHLLTAALQAKRTTSSCAPAPTRRPTSSCCASLWFTRALSRTFAG